MAQARARCRAIRARPLGTSGVGGLLERPLLELRGNSNVNHLLCCGGTRWSKPSGCTRDACGDIGDGAATAAHETEGVQLYAPIVSNGNVAVDGGTVRRSHEALTLLVGAVDAQFWLLQRGKWVYIGWRGEEGRQFPGCGRCMCIYCTGLEFAGLRASPLCQLQARGVSVYVHWLGAISSRLLIQVRREPCRASEVLPWRLTERSRNTSPRPAACVSCWASRMVRAGGDWAGRSFRKHPINSHSMSLELVVTAPALRCTPPLSTTLRWRCHQRTAAVHDRPPFILTACTFPLLTAVPAAAQGQANERARG